MSDHWHLLSVTYDIILEGVAFIDPLGHLWLGVSVFPSLPLSATITAPTYTFPPERDGFTGGRAGHNPGPEPELARS